MTAGERSTYRGRAYSVEQRGFVWTFRVHGVALAHNNCRSEEAAHRLARGVIDWVVDHLETGDAAARR